MFDDCEGFVIGLELIQTHLEIVSELLDIGKLRSTGVYVCICSKEFLLFCCSSMVSCVIRVRLTTVTVVELTAQYCAVLCCELCVLARVTGFTLQCKLGVLLRLWSYN